MSHCSYLKLSDVAALLEEIRGWANIREPRPGIFYFKSKPFLHFHEKDGRRWADVRDGVDWGKPLDLPFGASAAQKARFLKAARTRHGRIESAAKR